MSMATARTAHTIDNLWERIELTTKQLPHRHQTVLFKRDAEFLLEHRENAESEREKLTKRNEEHDSIRRMEEMMNGGDGSYYDLLKLSLPDSALAAKIHQHLCFGKIMKSALKAISEKIPNFAKTTIPKDVKSLPAFYQIFKDSAKKKDRVFARDIERAVKVFLWVKTQVEKPKPKKASHVGKKNNNESTPPTEHSRTTEPAPAVTKTLQEAGNHNLAFQCHLLLNTHPASSILTNAEYKESPHLEDRLRCLLDKLHALQMEVEKSKVEPKSSSVTSPRTSAASQVDLSPKTKQLQPNFSKTRIQRRSANQTDEGEVFLTNNQSKETSKLMVGQHCITCKRQYSKLSTDELTNSLPSSILSDVSLPHLPTQEAGKLKNVMKTASTNVQGRVLRRKKIQSAPVSGSIQVLVREERISALKFSQYQTSGRKEMQSRAVSARIYSPDKKRTVRLKNADTQTECIVDPREAPADVLFGDDEAEGPNQISFLPYGRLPSHIGFGINGHIREKVTMTPDTMASIIRTLSNDLDPGQWRELFTLLMEKTDESIVPQEIKEDIQQIEKEHKEDKMRVEASVKKWTQISGSLEAKTLLEALARLRRNDIIEIVKKHIRRLEAEKI